MPPGIGIAPSLTVSDRKQKLTGDQENPFDHPWIQPADDTDVADVGSEEAPRLENSAAPRAV